MMVALELLGPENEKSVLNIDRADIPPHFVELQEDTVALSHYGTQHGLKGFCFAVKAEGTYVGLLLVGEAIPDEADPAEVKGSPYFRVMGFVLDRQYRDRGIGRQALSLALERVYKAYGPAPVVLECHQENKAALRFYEKLGFVNTGRLTRDNYCMVKK